MVIQNAQIKITPVVLCGGSGSRLWPLSRTGFPKQFLVLSGTDSLFQQTIKRILPMQGADFQLATPLIVTNEEHRFLAQEQYRELGNGEAIFLLEPEGRNTAPALTLAALQATQDGEDSLLVVMPADQTIKLEDAFLSSLRQCLQAAQNGNILTMGVKPTRAETGFGYIKRVANATGPHGEYEVETFTEKPNLELAKSYVEGGEHAWNSGIFVVKASKWLELLETFRPDIKHATYQAWQARTVDQRFVRPSKELFAQIPSESIDFAVIEKCPGTQFGVRVVSLDAGWNDLGAWESVWLNAEKDGDGNVTQGDTLVVKTKNSLAYSSSRLLSLVGVEDLIVIETPDAVLVANRESSQEVKQVVQNLEAQGKRFEHLLHRKVQRPWGWYDSLEEADNFKVKRILVNPGASLSLQKHAHRAEHWIVVRGTAEITCGEKKFTLFQNQSTYIPVGELHRLTNTGDVSLEMIEVQSGTYLGEDDIVRVEDNYGRANTEGMSE
jgi:mannose-1-phosphate guanylyltransferase/mannose-6-phosphate isomerase